MGDREYKTESKQECKLKGIKSSKSKVEKPEQIGFIFKTFVMIISLYVIWVLFGVVAFVSHLG